MPLEPYAGFRVLCRHLKPLLNITARGPPLFAEALRAAKKALEALRPHFVHDVVLARVPDHL